MQKWEYDWVRRDMTDSLWRKRIREMGQKGWELVQIIEQEVWAEYNHTQERPVVGGVYLFAYFKRPKE